MADETKQEEQAARPLAEWRPDLPAAPHELRAQITYIPTRDGVRVFRQLPYGVIIEELTGEPLVPSPYPQMAAGPKCALHLTTPRIPWLSYAQIVAFFRAVHKKHTAEAIIRVFYDEAAKEWYLHCPEQDVTGGNVHHKDDFDSEGKYRHVADIHSHHTMSPFFSGTDDNDEKKAVRLYGVVGNIDRPIPGSSWRAWTGKAFQPLTILDVVEAPSDEEIVLPIRFKTNAIIKEKDGVRDLTIPPTAIAEALFPSDFPEEWMKKVNAGRVTFYGGPTLGVDRTPTRGSWKWDGTKWWRKDFLGNLETRDGANGQHPLLEDEDDFSESDDYYRASGGHGRAGFRPGAREFGGGGRGKENGEGRSTRRAASTSDPQRPRLSPDFWGTAPQMVHGALAAAKNDNALVYLVSVSDDTVFRVESATAIVEKDFPAIDLVQLKERKAKSDTPVLVYACLHVSDELLSPYLKAKGVKES